ncbi:MAG TPA: MEDS domain-containing protein [Solirubrobacteraceae bacterium]|jgi:hypothetical protein|nr:MEDS domain-containing protein [Solirubrobacteraceae bacterium]
MITRDRVTTLLHEAFVYEDDEEFLGRIAPHLRAGLEASETAVAVLTRSAWVAMRDALGAHATSEVRFLDCDARYLRPARTVAAYHALVRRVVAERGTRVRIVAETPPSQMPAEGARPHGAVRHARRWEASTGDNGKALGVGSRRKRRLAR